MIIETQKIMDNRSLPYIQTLEQTTITLQMINPAQQIFLCLVCLLTFFVPLQSFFLSSLVNMYTKILISQQQEEEWREFAKSWILVLNLHVAVFSRRILFEPHRAIQQRRVLWYQIQDRRWWDFRCCGRCDIHGLVRSQWERKRILVSSD